MGASFMRGTGHGLFPKSMILWQMLMLLDSGAYTKDIADGSWLTLCTEYDTGFHGLHGDPRQAISRPDT